VSALPDLQLEFQRAVLAREERSGLFLPSPGEGGFDIYANAYCARLASALRDNYPVLFLALGDEMFDTLSSAYIELQPSRYRSIRWFGDRLAEFMDAHNELTPHPSLSDLARMDWALRSAFDAANDAALEVGDLAQLAPEAWPSKRFSLCASVALVSMQWRIEPVWQALNQDAGAETEPPDALTHTLLVWRNKLECQWRSLPDAEAAGLQALATGDSFEEICATMMATDDSITVMASAVMLRQWVEQGLIAKG
jgi:Putative DNA-binding domain